MSTINDIIVPRRDAPSALPPNHHAGAGPSSGVLGYLSGLTMLVGRQRDAQLVCHLAEVGRNHHVVDIGCGPGTAARAAARAGARVTGVDPSTPMLRLARAFSWRRRACGEMRWRRAAAEDLPLPVESSTVCWSLASVHHWRDLDAAIAEVLRVLQPGGRFVALEHRVREGAAGHASHGWTPTQAERFAALLADAGFLHVEVRDHDLGRRGVVSVIGTKPEVQTTSSCADHSTSR